MKRRLLNIALVVVILAICASPLATYAAEPVYTGVQAVFNQEEVRAQVGVPTGVNIGNVFFGFSLPVWNAMGNINEELHYQVDVPNWWNGTSDILVHVHTATTGDESGCSYELQLTSNYSTPNIVEAFPAAGDYSEIQDRPIASNLTNAHYMEVFTIPYNNNPADVIVSDDVLGLRIRRVNVNQQDNLKGELIVINEVVVYFARGDMLGEEAAMAVAILSIAAVMIVGILGLIALGLTIALFWAREPMLGFAAVIFWLVFGGACFWRSTAVWDIYYTVGFASMLGMTVLCGAGAFQFYKGSKKGRSNENSDFIDENEGTQYLGESKKEANRENKLEDDDSMSDEEMNRPSQPSARTQELRERARKRKTGIFRKKNPWGEFK